MRLLTPTAWVEKYFAEGSRPPETTLRRWMNSGAVPALKIGGSWFVDDDAWRAGGDELVQRVLEAS
jgi:hypothetical protein